MATLDPDALKQFQFLVFTKLEGAVTAGMIHLGDQLGLYRALADADDALTSAELAARTGLDERWVREWAFNQAAARILDVAGETGALLAGAGGRRRAGVARARGVRRRDVPRSAADAGRPRAAAGELPQRARLRLRQPRAGVGDRHGAQLRAVEPGPPAADRAADARRSSSTSSPPGPRSPTSAAARAAPSCCSPRRSRTAASPATTSPASPSTAPRPASPRPVSTTPRSTMPASTRCRPTTPSTSSRRSTASTT